MIENPELKIRILREMKAYTQENIADELGISTKAYQKIESGETQLTINKLNSIAKVLDINPMDILQFEESIFFENMKRKEPLFMEGKKVEMADETSPRINSVLMHNIESLKQEVDFLRKIISKNFDL